MFRILVQRCVIMSNGLFERRSRAKDIAKVGMRLDQQRIRCDGASIISLSHVVVVFGLVWTPQLEQCRREVRRQVNSALKCLPRGTKLVQRGRSQSVIVVARRQIRPPFNRALGKQYGGIRFPGIYESPARSDRDSGTPGCRYRARAKADAAAVFLPTAFKTRPRLE